MNNRTIRLLVAITAAFGLILAMAAMVSADPVTPYVQASTSYDQHDGGLVEFDTLDGAAGITFNDANDSFTVAADGVYVIIAAPQVGGIQNQHAKGSANFWISINSQPVANSNVTWQSAQGSDGDVIISQGVTHLSAGDVVTVEWSTTGPALEAITTAGEPLTPSIIFTMFGI